MFYELQFHRSNYVCVIKEWTIIYYLHKMLHYLQIVLYLSTGLSANYIFKMKFSWSPYFLAAQNMLSIVSLFSLKYNGQDVVLFVPIIKCVQPLHICVS
jgi:hypothetical protein